MFLESNELTIKILSVFRYESEDNSGSYSPRPFNSISFRIKGDSEIQYQGGFTNAKTGDIVFVPAGCSYNLTAGAEKLIIVHFTAHEQLPNQIKKYSVTNFKYFERKFNELNSAWMEKKYCYRFECNSLLNKILYQLETELIHTKMFNIKSTLPDVIDYIHDNFTRSNLSISQLANLCGTSGTYFRELFEKNFNTSPLKYIHDLRLEYAKELLKSGHYSIAEVSELSGFSDPNYFSAFVKKKTGSYPSKFLEKL